MQIPTPYSPQVNSEGATVFLNFTVKMRDERVVSFRKNASTGAWEYHRLGGVWMQFTRASDHRVYDALEAAYAQRLIDSRSHVQSQAS